MANHKSALKRARQNFKRRMRNRSVKTRAKNVVKQVRLAVNENAPEVEDQLDLAKSTLAKAAKKGVLHHKTAARKISRLSRLVNSANT